MLKLLEHVGEGNLKWTVIKKFDLPKDKENASPEEKEAHCQLFGGYYIAEENCCLTSWVEQTNYSIEFIRDMKARTLRSRR